MDPNLQKSRFSLAYIEAVAAQTGFHVEEVKVDRDSIDGTLMADFGKRPRIEFQAKATAQDVINEDHIHFPLPAKNYRDLIEETINPRILIVAVVPTEVNLWVNQTQDELCMRHSAYWLSLAGKPPSSNKTSVTVRLPLANMFNRGQLVDLMRNAERRGEL